MSLPRLGLTAAALVVAGIVAFYLSRLLVPLPLWAADEVAFLLHAIYPDQVVAADPNVASANNGVHLSAIRLAYALGSPILGDRLINAGAYLGGLALVWRASTARLPRTDQIALGLLALGFPYYSFAFSNLAEGLFVGVLALICVATGRWWRSRPILHAVLAGTLAAVLVLVKPNGIALVCALAAVALADAAASRDWRRLPLRAALFAACFFGVGNLLQFAADEQVANPLKFFVGQLYAGALALKPGPDAPRLAALQVLAMTSACALLAGAPIVLGLASLAKRWRAQPARFEASPWELTFLLLLLSLAATVAMVTIFAIEVSGIPSETLRLWGRYFTFYLPLLWLAAAPALAQPVDRRLALACAGVTLAGLMGLLASLYAGVVLFPWDDAILTAFFHPDPVRAPLDSHTPFRLLATVASLGAIAALALRARPVAAGLGLILALAVLSTGLDHSWVGGMVAQRQAQARDLRAIPPLLPERGEVLLLTDDINLDHLAFLQLRARPAVISGAPETAPASQVNLAAAVLATGPAPPPGGPWARTFKGEVLSLYRHADAR